MTRFVLAILLLGLSEAVVQAQMTVTQLLQSPRQFVGQRVTVSGYYYGDAEGQIIYADRAAATRGDIDRSTSVAVLPPVYCREPRPAFVTGIFFSDPHHKLNEGFGTFGLFSSELRNAIVYLRKHLTKPCSERLPRRSSQISYD
jgi:hypothetical protein